MYEENGLAGRVKKGRKKMGSDGGKREEKCGVGPEKDQ
jgi:hypothetical protein